MVGEGGESEVIAPLSKLPAMFSALYGDQLLAASSQQPTVIQINNPVVREEQDIDKIAKAVEKVLAGKAKNSMRLGNAYYVKK